MDREAWRAAVHGVAKSRTRLSDSTETEYHLHRAAVRNSRKLHMRVSNPTAKGVCQTFRNWLRLAAFIPSPLQAPAQASSDARRCSPPLASALLTAPLNALLICSSHSPALTPPHPGPQLSGPSWRASRQLLSLLYHHLLISFSAATLSSP